MTFDPTDSYDENRVCLTVTGEVQGFNVTAYSCPDAIGRTFIDGGETEIGDVSKSERYRAPFSVDVVIEDNIYPQEGEIESLRKELGEDFSNQFDQKLDNVFDKLSDDDDPIEALDGVDDNIV